MIPFRILSSQKYFCSKKESFDEALSNRLDMEPDYIAHSFVEIFSQVGDPRHHRTRKHDLIDILFAALCAILCGAEDCVAMADFARGRLNLLRKFVKMRGGPPSHDTFSRVLAVMSPTQFSECFILWTQMLQQQTAGGVKALNGEVIALDGKTVRHSFDTATGKAAIHMVSAWGALNGLVLGQVKVSEKSNEITAIPELLRLLDIGGATITIDAMGTQKQIAAQIVEGGADYILAVKGNQPDLQADLHAFFERTHRDRFLDAQANVIPHTRCQTRDADHGRIETRTCIASDMLDQIPSASAWTNLRSLVQVQSERRVGDKVTHETRYYITSRAPDAAKILQDIRLHWRIENCLHWVLDVTFDEDRNRTRLGHGPENLAALRHIALNVFKSNTTRKASVRRKRNMAAWDPEFVIELLTNQKLN